MTQSTRTITHALAAEWGLPYNCASEDTAAESPGTAVELHDEQTGTLRWVSVHRLTFRAPDDNRTYTVNYARGLHAYCDPWLYQFTADITLTAVGQQQPAEGDFPDDQPPPTDLDAIRAVTARLAAHAEGFQEVLDDDDRGPWGHLVGADIAELQHLVTHLPAGTPERLAELEADATRFKADYLGACETIAAMHAAATGRASEAPIRGVVEDMADVRARVLELERQIAGATATGNTP